MLRRGHAIIKNSVINTPLYVEILTKVGLFFIRKFFKVPGATSKKNLIHNY